MWNWNVNQKYDKTENKQKQLNKAWDISYDSINIYV